MFRTASLVAVVLAVAVGAAAAPPNRPDLSGDWTLDLRQSTLDPRIAGGIESGTMTIVHKEPAFELRRTFTKAGKPDSVAFALTTDGVEQSKVEGPVTWRMRMVWQGDVLVASMRGRTPQGEATNVVRYRLLDGGRTLEARESFRGPKLQYDNVWILHK